MKKSITCLLVLAMLTAGAQAFAAILLPAEGIIAANAHLRAEPTAESRSKMILMAGYRVTVQEVAGTWLLVKYGRFTGYIRSDLITFDFHVPVEGEQGTGMGSLPGGGTYPVLRYGAQGDAVRMLQMNLLDLGYAVGAPDGVFGEATRMALLYFQNDYGLAMDGVAGNETYRALEAALQNGVG